MQRLLIIYILTIGKNVDITFIANDTWLE